MAGRAYTPQELRNPTPPIVLQWEDFQTMFLDSHEQGEHVAIVGPTGSGKTLVGLELCKLVGSRRGREGRPSAVTVLQYKPRDDTLRLILPEEQWPIIKNWPPGYGEEHCVVWPRPTKASEAATRQRAVFLPLLDEMYMEGGQTVYIPEAAHFERPYNKGGRNSGLGMGATMQEFWSAARSLKLTVIADTQRPREVTRLMWSEPSWLIIFRLNDDEDVKRVAELSGDRLGVWAAHQRLGGYEFICVKRQRAAEHELYVSRADAP